MIIPIIEFTETPTLAQVQSKIDNGDYNGTLEYYSFLTHCAEGIARVDKDTRTAEIIGGGNSATNIYRLSYNPDVAVGEAPGMLVTSQLSPIFGDWSIKTGDFVVSDNSIFAITGYSQGFVAVKCVFKSPTSGGSGGGTVIVESAGVELFPYLMCTNSDQMIENINAVGRVFAVMFTPVVGKSITKLQYIIAQSAPSNFEFALYRYTGAFSNGSIPVEFLAKTAQVSNAAVGLVEATFGNAVQLSAQEVYYLVVRTAQGDQIPRLRSANLNLLQDNYAAAVLRGQNVSDIAGFTSLSGLEKLSGLRIVPYVKMY
jgi:hypothetical protein